jgi:hypothetical protein
MNTRLGESKESSLQGRKQLPVLSGKWSQTRSGELQGLLILALIQQPEIRDTKINSPAGNRLTVIKQNQQWSNPIE